MKAFGMAAALLAVASTPVQAQDAPLSEDQITFFAEVLAMALACDELEAYSVRYEKLGDWINERLAHVPEADLESMLAQRDDKIVELQQAAQGIRDMRQGGAREIAEDEHYAEIVTRCNRMTEHSLTRDYFVRRSG